MTGYFYYFPYCGRYSSKEIVQMRYASGELSREEYLTIIKDIESAENDENKSDKQIFK